MVVEGKNNGYDCLMLLPHMLAFFAMPWIQTVRYKTAELTTVVPQLSDFNFEQTGAHFDIKKFCQSIFYSFSMERACGTFLFGVLFSCCIAWCVQHCFFFCSIQAAVMAVTQSHLASQPRSEKWMILRSVLHKT